MPLAKSLEIFWIVGSTVHQRHDVVKLGSRPPPAFLKTLHAQGLRLKVRFAKSLQFVTSNASDQPRGRVNLPLTRLFMHPI